jgi:hypothetical protein
MTSRTDHYERVYTVTDYLDQPRQGIAALKGEPYAFQGIFDQDADEWSNRYYLKPLDAETFALAMEAWGIWRRWKDAFRGGEVDQDSHPALPQDRERMTQLSDQLGPLLAIDPASALVAEGHFRAIRPMKGGDDAEAVEVFWDLLPTSVADRRA